VTGVQDATVFTTSYDKQFSLTSSATVKTEDGVVLRLAFCEQDDILGSQTLSLIC
jgi:hypothetical protein